MYFLALAADYDGTLAEDGAIRSTTFDALTRFKATGRRLVLVTGRALPDLLSVCADLSPFDRVVAENGALLYDPASQAEQLIGNAPPAIFVERLKDRRIEPLSVGRSIVATWEPHETAVLEIIRDLGLELQIIFNKGAVMVLPAGVNKATGLTAALRELNLSPHNVVGVGDAENDHAFLQLCGCSAAVANALPLLKKSVDVVLAGARGPGVEELIARVSADDAAIIPAARHGIPLGTLDGREVLIEPHRGSVLIAGRSGIGKSTLATALTERMIERGFQFCVFDPEGDYDDLQGAVSLGDAATPPQDDEVLKLLDQADTNVVINTLNFALAERPTFFARLLPRLGTLRLRTGRPHWLLIDEAHHLLPADRADFRLLLPEDMPAVVFITVHPAEVSIEALETVETIVAVGDKAPDVVAEFCRAAELAAPPKVPVPSDGEIVVWRCRSRSGPMLVKAHQPRQAHQRHTRKYAAGDLGGEDSFYFRGPDGRLNLRAQNLSIFLQIADGVDEATWEHHRRAHDFSEWFRDVIKDPELAAEAAAIERDDRLDARASFGKLADAVARRYTAPATTRTS